MQTDNNNTQVAGKWKFSGTTIRNGRDFQSWKPQSITLKTYNV